MTTLDLHVIEIAQIIAKVCKIFLLGYGFPPEARPGVGIVPPPQPVSSAFRGS